MRKTILQDYKSCSVQKTARKKTKYSRNESNLKISYVAKPIAHANPIKPLQNGQFGSKIKNAKNMRKTILQNYKSCSVQKTVPKNTKYSKNERTLKISHLAKTIALAKALAFAKWSVLVKN